MANKKTFTIEIKGIETAYNNVIKLRDAIKSIDDIHPDIDGNINIVTNNIEQNLGDLAQASIIVEQSFTELTYTVNENTAATEENANADTVKLDSIKSLKKTLEDLQKEYESLSKAERKSSEGQAMLAKINKLTKEIEIASNKNYGYVKSLDNISKATQNVNGFFTEVSTLLKEGSGIAKTFGVNVDSVTTVLNGMEKAIQAVSFIQKLMNTVTSIATVIQQGFNQAVKANPLMALATAIIAAVTAVYGFITATEKATEASDKNAESTSKMNKRMEETYELHKQTAEIAGETRQAYEELRKKWNELKTDQEKNQFIKDNKENFNKLGVEVNNVKEAENLLVKNTETFIKAMNARAKATAAQQMMTKQYSKLLEAELNKETAIKKFREENPTSKYTNEEIDNFLKKLNVDPTEEPRKKLEELNEIMEKSQEDFANFIKETGTTEASENGKNGKKNNCSNGRRQEKEELDSQKELTEGYKKLNEAKENLSNKNIDREEKERRANAKTVDELKAIQKEQLEKTKSAQEQEVTETEATYDKLIKIAGDKTKEAKVLANQKALHIEEINKDHANELNIIAQDNQKEQIDLLTKEYDQKIEIITEQNAKIEELEKNKKATKKNDDIDVEQTQNNIKKIGESLENYRALLESNKADITSYYDGLALIYEGDAKKTEENEARKQKALDENTTTINAIQKKIDRNAEESAEVIGEYYKELAEKVTNIASKIKENVANIFSAVSDMIKGQVEEAKENLTTVTKQYDEVVEKKKESQEKLKSLEEEAKTASGGRATVVQEQIARQMEANNELAAQEKDLAKQKEKAEKEKAKKEKQQKKVELAQQLVTGIANIAMGITKALAMGPIIGPIMASIVGAMGAIQTATIAKQMSKLEDGGILRGKRHAQGGMRIEGTNIEVEGDEYVVNRVSTGKNLGLIDYINKNRRELKADDINNYFSRIGNGNQQLAIPTKQMYEQGGVLTNLEVVDSLNSRDNDKILEAISQINFKPVVSVVDITSAQNNLSEVKDIAGA